MMIARLVGIRKTEAHHVVIIVKSSDRNLEKVSVILDKEEEEEKEKEEQEDAGRKTMMTARLVSTSKTRPTTAQHVVIIFKVW